MQSTPKKVAMSILTWELGSYLFKTIIKSKI